MSYWFCKLCHLKKYFGYNRWAEGLVQREIKEHYDQEHPNQTIQIEAR